MACPSSVKSGLDSPSPPGEATGARHRVTEQGGRAPIWSLDGSELYYDVNGKLYAMKFLGEDSLETVRISGAASYRKAAYNKRSYRFSRRATKRNAYGPEGSHAWYRLLLQRRT